MTRGDSVPQDMRRPADASNAELIQRMMAADELAPTVTLENADVAQLAIITRAGNARAELDAREAKR